MLINCDACGVECNKYPKDIKRNKKNYCSKKCSYDDKRIDIFSYHLMQIRQRFRRDNIKVAISAKDLHYKWTGYCSLSGEELNLGCSRVDIRKNSNASVDRKDSSKGYTPDNIQWVTKKVNIAKHVLSDEDFITMCKQVARHNGGL